MSQPEFEKVLKSVPGLSDLIKEYQKSQPDAVKLFLMEFALHGLAEYSQISKHSLTAGNQFKDLLSSMFTIPKNFSEDDENDDEALGGGRRR